MPGFFLFLLVLAVLGFVVVRRNRRLKRRILAAWERTLGNDDRRWRVIQIEDFDFPPTVRADFATGHSEMDAKSQADVFRALKDYFIMRAALPDETLPMPSRIVGEAWCLFAEDAAEYEAFSIMAFGRILAPEPESGVGDDIRRCWEVACARARIDPARPRRLPLLFSLDSRLGVKGGNFYALNPSDAEHIRRQVDSMAVIVLAADLGGGTWSDPVAMDIAGLDFGQMSNAGVNLDASLDGGFEGGFDGGGDGGFDGGGGGGGGDGGGM